jgi:hypothetical protein
METTSGTSESFALAAAEFEIAEGVNEIQVPITSISASTHGHVRFDSEPHPLPEELRINEIPLRGQFTILDEYKGDSIGIDPNGDFVLGARTAVRMALTIEPRSTLKNHYLKSVLLGGKESLTTGILFDARGSRLELLIAGDGGAISGHVVDAAGRPVVRSTVVALPDAEHRKTYACVEADSTDTTGKFTITGICPGRYTLLALPPEAPAGIYWDPAFVQAHEMLGVVLDVKSNSRQSIQLSPIKLD